MTEKPEKDDRSDAKHGKGADGGLNTGPGRSGERGNGNRGVGNRDDDDQGTGDPSDPGFGVRGNGDRL